MFLVNGASKNARGGDLVYGCVGKPVDWLVDAGLGSCRASWVGSVLVVQRQPFLFGRTLCRDRYKRCRMVFREGAGSLSWAYSRYVPRFLCLCFSTTGLTGPVIHGLSCRLRFSRYRPVLSARSPMLLPCVWNAREARSTI